MSYILSSDVSIVELNNNVLEFFKTNTRESIKIRTEDDTVLKIVKKLNGNLSIEELSAKYDVSLESIEKLISFLANNSLLDDVIPMYDFKEYFKYRRVINFLNDFSTSHNELLDMWNNIKTGNVLIIGLGAVGTWVTCNLAQSGVENFILMDNDIVEITNLHRQYGYCENDTGKKKVEVLEKRLKKYNSNIKVDKIDKSLDAHTLQELDCVKKIDLIINCADKPTVDQTSLWVGEYGMKRGIPHIVGGGYNLHLSLIGQTIIPYESACVKCFEKQLKEDNKIDKNRVKKLSVKNRKVGSFGPMCSIIASFIGMEAIKVLTKKIQPANINRRGEFDIFSMKITYKNFERRADCEWCGNGRNSCK